MDIGHSEIIDHRCWCTAKQECPFPIGEERTMFAQYFSKKSYAAILSTEPVAIAAPGEGASCEWLESAAE